MTTQNLQYWKYRWHHVISKICAIKSQAELSALLDQLNAITKPHILAFVNAHAMNMVAKNVQFWSALDSADTVLRDGSGMAILFRALRIKPGLNLNGTDFIPKVIANLNIKRIALYGTQAPQLTIAATEVCKINTVCDVVIETGFYPIEHYLKLAEKTMPELIILGMGMPKQELVASLLRTNLKYPCLIICGGAIIDFLGKKISRAPKFMQILGIEWVYRLLIEPKRMFNRYIVGNPLFLWRTLRVALPLAD